jgi:hypothetical protein
MTQGIGTVVFRRDTGMLLHGLGALRVRGGEFHFKLHHEGPDGTPHRVSGS